MSLNQEEIDIIKTADFFGSDWGRYEKDGRIRL